ncbi:uncharacterized protein LOC143291138 [Babylonia areolata]|uniref:uncharacterized protein LOC143291138 n=1 Tax=Babylonia areolata TaxID=304850 RepID=UPI003FD1A6D8
MSPRLLAGIATGVMAVAMILQIVGVATPSWVSGKVQQGATSSAGLWRICATAQDKEACVDWPVVPDWLDASRAFGILSLLLMIAASGLGVFASMKHDSRGVLLLAAVSGGLGALCSLISFGVFAGEKDDSFPNVFDYDYSFGLCVVAAVLGCIGSVICLVTYFWN